MVKNLKHKPSSLENKMSSSESTAAPKSEAPNNPPIEQAAHPIAHHSFVPPMPSMPTMDPKEPFPARNAESINSLPFGQAGSFPNYMRADSYTGRRPLLPHEIPHFGSHMAHGYPSVPSSVMAAPATSNQPSTSSIMDTTAIYPSDYSRHLDYQRYIATACSGAHPAPVSEPSLLNSSTLVQPNASLPVSMAYHPYPPSISTNWPHYYPHLAPQYSKLNSRSNYENGQQEQTERKLKGPLSTAGPDRTEIQARDDIAKISKVVQDRNEFIKTATVAEERAKDAMARLGNLRSKMEQHNKGKILGQSETHRTVEAPRSRDHYGFIKASVKVGGENKLKAIEEYTEPFCKFMTESPTVWHAVSAFEDRLTKSGFTKLSERKAWNDELVKGGKYFISRNGSSLVAFTIGNAYKSGNGVAMVGGHVDALTAKLKPVSNKRTAAGYIQLGVAPYAGGLNATWWDRDLGIGGRVILKDSKTGKITTKLVKLGWPIARIPTLAPHFGVGMMGQSNQETQMVPIIGLDGNSDASSTTADFANLTLGEAGSFAATQPPKLIKAIASELSITDYSSIINWELELYDTQPAQTLGLDREFISAGRIDDKVCSWAAIEGLLADAASSSSTDDGIVKLAGVFDDEEIGSLLRQGAKGNFLPSVIERITEAFAPSGLLSGANLLSQTYANSFLISADVTHAINPNFQASYLENHAPRLNVGLCIAADSNGHMTTDALSTALLTRVAEKSGNKLQLFMIRNDSRSGGTIGPELSSLMGVRAIDAGIPQLSMHSIRATIGSLDPGLGVKIFAGFFENYEAVDAEFDPAMS